MKSLREIRESKGVTQTAISRHLCCSTKTYSAYEKRPERMKIETAFEVADFLGVEIGDIFFISNRK